MSPRQSCDSLDLGFAESFLLESKSSGKPATFIQEFPLPKRCSVCPPRLQRCFFFLSPAFTLGAVVLLWVSGNSSVSVGAWYDVNVSSG